MDEAVRETGASAAKDMGRVMKAVMPKLAGRGADGKVVNELVRRRLGAPEPPPNFFARFPSKDIDRLTRASRPSSTWPLPQGRGFFLSAW